ncbi:DUF1983 domain-containing protein (plasmid) [Enterobacter sp. A103]|nr:DUF1983 domain-containing protein [Enterobacter sp. A103]MDZ5641666.1 DUF1983 domain-containing protein [Enterobacter sp. A103]
MTEHATLLGTGTLWVRDNLLPGKAYWFYVRSVNVAGRSVFVEATGTPRSDAEGMLPIFREKIDQSWLGSEFYKKIDNSELQGDFTNLSQKVDDTKSEIEQMVGKQLGDQTTTIQQIEKVQAETGNKLNAMWAVKLQQLSNGQYYIAGLGVGMENTPEGMQSQILMAADRIAMVNPADGNTTPLFVAQGNQLIMNEVYLKNLYAAQITSSGSPPSFSLTPDGLLTARQATISGDITATSGHFSNAVIDETCEIKGMLEATHIRGDLGDFLIAQSEHYDAGTPTASGTLLVLTRQAIPVKVGLFGTGLSSASIGTWGTIENGTVHSAWCRIKLGSTVVWEVSGVFNGNIPAISFILPAGAGDVSLTWECGHTGGTGGPRTRFNADYSVFAFRQAGLLRRH